MSTKLGTILADFTTALSTDIAVGGTTATLSSATDDDGVALPSGRYFFTLDGSNSSKEHISCDLVGTALTNIKSLSRQGVETTGAVRKHRIGTSVSLTDFGHIKFINDLVSGATNLNGTAPLGYDSEPTSLSGSQLATVTYVLGVVNGGAVTFDQQTISNQTSGEALAINDVVYFKEADAKWYKADADLTATFDQLQIGINKTTATGSGEVIQIAISGPVSAFSGLTAGSKYYLSNTAGSITTTAGTFSVFLGWALNTTTLLFNPILKTLPTQKEKDALIGSQGVPSSTNKYVTESGMGGSFGDGSDGDVTVSGTTTLTSDMYYNDLIVTGTLNTAGYRVFVKGTLSGNGIIQNNGNNGSAGTPGAQGAGGLGGTITTGYFSNIPGTAGGTGPSTGQGLPGNSGTASSAETSLLITTASSVGGAAGGSSGAAGGSGGTSGTRTGVLTKFGVVKFQTIGGLDITSTGSLVKDKPSMPGTGGGSGGSGNDSSGSGSGGAGGGGGASGGIVAIYVSSFTGTITIKALGGDGGTGASGTGSHYGGGGGGAGGNGGYIFVVYGTKTWTGSYIVTGGTGGAGAIGAGTGTTGSSGNNGSDGLSKEISITNLI